mgnify:CR=1 FL=1
MNKSKNNTLVKLRNYVDGEADTPYEYFMLLVIIVNTVSIGLETSKNISESFRNVLFWIDKICLCIFIAELIFKAIVYNRDFFGENRNDENGNEYFHVNRWNISDLIIVVVSLISSLSYFAIFRVFRVFRSFKVIKAIHSLRIIKSFKLVNEVSSLRTIFKGLLKAIPGIIATFSFLAIFAYAYAIIGTNIFSEDFPQFFGSLGTSILTLCQVTTFDSWFSGITRPITQVYPWAWIYFVSYAFIAASVIMNVIVGIIVDSMRNERERQKAKRNSQKKDVSLETLSKQIQELQTQIEKLENKLS